MRKYLNTESVRDALTELGWTQSKLAHSVGVSSQSVTNWLKGTDFPRPATLLKLATTLKLTNDQLVITDTKDTPIIAFRKKGNAKTKHSHITNAREIGYLLKPLVGYLENINVLRTQITSPSTNYKSIQVAVSQTRSRLGIGETTTLKYERLINEFKSCGAILVPVLRGLKSSHENALHIRLPEHDCTFIFLNLDTYLEDFKFWMAHELAHVYTPTLTGSEEGEDFADAFAAALLFPKSCAEAAYCNVKAKNSTSAINELKRHAYEHSISINTVYQQVKLFAKNRGLQPLDINERDLHKIRNSNKLPLVSHVLFDPTPPEAKPYITASRKIFQTDFFDALSKMINDREIGATYIQQILDISIQDAHAIYEALTH